MMRQLGASGESEPPWVRTSSPSSFYTQETNGIGGHIGGVSRRTFTTEREALDLARTVLVEAAKRPGENKPFTTTLSDLILERPDRSRVSGDDLRGLLGLDAN
jgi:hypothetical protein